MKTSQPLCVVIFSINIPSLAMVDQPWTNKYMASWRRFPRRYTRYGINQLALFACYSADNDVDRSKNAHASKYRYNLWEWNVARRGWFFGYEGEANLLNEIFRWGAAQGRNINYGEE